MLMTTRPSATRAIVRATIVVASDFISALVALIGAIMLRVGPENASIILAKVPWIMPCFLLTAAVAFWLFGLERRLWSYASLSDLIAIAQASFVSIAVFVGLLALAGKLGWMPRSVPVIMWFLSVVLLGGSRMAWRMASGFVRGAVHPPLPRRAAQRPSRATLIIGAGDDVDAMLRHLETHPETGFRPVGVLGDLGIHRRARIRGLPILGGYGELAKVVERLEAEQQRPQCLLFAGEAERLRGAAMVNIIAAAQQLGLQVAHAEGLTMLRQNSATNVDFRFFDIADLLGRPQKQLDDGAVRATISGRRVMVTGAGGTIGRELVRQIAALGPAEIQLLDANEFALYEVDLEMRENFPTLPRQTLLCSIRQRRQMMRLFDKHRPELVYHAAALKHVPLVEANLSAGMLTNVVGTRNVADAVRRYGARAMIQVSTDKAVNPVGFMGMTKRLGELYCQALDLAGERRPDAPRFMTVRFGNVLGSSGSLIPLFQRQLSRGGPLTVTHPDMCRFFMTVHEAVQLVLHSSGRGLGGELERGRIYVLDMGKPVKIMDVAERMIRMAGLEPGIDVAIDIVGLRPGEKLYEELFDADERQLPSAVAGVFEAIPDALPIGVMAPAFDAIEQAAINGDDQTCCRLARDLLQGGAISVTTFDQAFAEPREPIRLIGAGA